MPLGAVRPHGLTRLARCRRKIRGARCAPDDDILSSVQGAAGARSLGARGLGPRRGIARMTTRSAAFGFGLVMAINLAPVAVRADEGALQEVVVTAQKRQERLIDVPMTLNVVKGVELEQQSLQTMQDLSFAVPGMTTREDGPGTYTIFMRGVSNDYGTGALVGQYLDEVPVSLTGYDQLDVRVMDLDRVEVLKGPQGTLYGQGSVAGTVRYITRDPVLNAYQGRI